MIKIHIRIGKIQNHIRLFAVFKIFSEKVVFVNSDEAVHEGHNLRKDGQQSVVADDAYFAGVLFKNVNKSGYDNGVSDAVSGHQNGHTAAGFFPDTVRNALLHFLIREVFVLLLNKTVHYQVEPDSEHS